MIQENKSSDYFYKEMQNWIEKRIVNVQTKLEGFLIVSRYFEFVNSQFEA